MKIETQISNSFILFIVLTFQKKINVCDTVCSIQFSLVWTSSFNSMSLILKKVKQRLAME